MHTFIYGILGGIMIGLAAAILLLCSGDMLAASCVASSLGNAPLQLVQDPLKHWRLVMVASFCLTANLFFGSPKYEDKDATLAGMSPAAFAIGGFLTGLGTRLGNGCTSGHGVCGLGRLSKRSFVSVGIFLPVGIITAYLTKDETTPFPKKAFEFLRDTDEEPVKFWNTAASVMVFLLVVAALAAPTVHSLLDRKRHGINNKNSNNSYQLSTELFNTTRKVAPAAVSGVLFATGLYVSRMVFPTAVFGFLNFGLLERGGNNWDATLMFVLGGACTVSFLSYQMVDGYNFLLGDKSPKFTQPLNLVEGSKFSIPTSQTIDAQLILGATFFGLGWGISGLCPGPAIFLAAIGVSWVLVCYWPAFFVGSYLAKIIKRTCKTEDTIEEEGEEEEKAPPTTDEHSTSGSLQERTNNKEDEPLNPAELNA